MKNFERIIIYSLLAVGLFYSFLLSYGMDNISKEIKTENLLITNSKGKVVGGIGINSNGEPTFVLTNKEGKRVVGIKSNNGHGVISIFGQENKILLELSSDENGLINIRNGGVKLYNDKDNLISYLA